MEQESIRWKISSKWSTREELLSSGTNPAIIRGIIRFGRPNTELVRGRREGRPYLLRLKSSGVLAFCILISIVVERSSKVLQRIKSGAFARHKITARIAECTKHGIAADSTFQADNFHHCGMLVGLLCI